MLALMGVGIIGLVLSVGGNVSDLKPGHYALGGVTILPTMLTVLVLIVMESDAMHQAKHGIVAKWYVEKNPNPEAVLVEE